MGFGIRERTILVNSLIIIGVVYAFTNLVFQFVKTIDFPISVNPLLYFTNWSNILAVVAAVCALYCVFKGNKLPRSVAVLKLSSLLMLTVTFLVVLFVLGPIKGWELLFDPGGLLFLHCIVPILSLIDYLYNVEIDPPEKRDVMLSVLPMLLYAIGIVAVLLIAGNDDLAPYPFLRIHSQPVYVTILWFAGIAVVGFALSYGYSRLVRRTNPNLKASDGSA